MPIQSGAPLVWWLSAEAIRDPIERGPWEGTFFAHGIFFTHSAMPLALKDAEGELKKSSYKNAREQQRWWRPEFPKYAV